MKLREPYSLPEDKQALVRKAMVLEWLTIFFLVTIGALMYLTMGSSQAMKTAWIEDMLSLVPPISFLVAMHIRERQPTAKHPYGYRRAVLIAFLVAAAAIVVLGLYMLYDSAHALLTRHHPSLGYFTIFGQKWEIWSGWVMIGALVYSIIPVFILGRMKLPLAEELHEKTLHADAAMNKADWMTAGAAILGVLGIGIGWWWADSVAAALIALDVLKDGLTNLKSAMSDLMDQRPSAVNSERALDLPTRICKELKGLPGVLDADIRLREEGHVFAGELFVTLEEDGELPARLDALVARARGMDWRIHELVAVPVSRTADPNPD